MYKYKCKYINVYRFVKRSSLKKTTHYMLLTISHSGKARTREAVKRWAVARVPEEAGINRRSTEDLEGSEPTLHDPGTVDT